MFKCLDLTALRKWYLLRMVKGWWHAQRSGVPRWHVPRTGLPANSLRSDGGQWCEVKNLEDKLYTLGGEWGVSLSFQRDAELREYPRKVDTISPKEKFHLGAGSRAVRVLHGHLPEAHWYRKLTPASPSSPPGGSAFGEHRQRCTAGFDLNL